jgi:hypothetical protein
MADRLLASSNENEKELERAKAECQNLAAQLAGEASTTQVHETLPQQQHGVRGAISANWLAVGTMPFVS